MGQGEEREEGRIKRVVELIYELRHGLFMLLLRAMEYSSRRGRVTDQRRIWDTIGDLGNKEQEFRKIHLKKNSIINQRQYQIKDMKSLTLTSHHLNLFYFIAPSLLPR